MCLPHDSQPKKAADVCNTTQCHNSELLTVSLIWPWPCGPPVCIRWLFCARRPQQCGHKKVNLSDESPSSCRGSEPKRILRTGKNVTTSTWTWTLVSNGAYVLYVLFGGALQEHQKKADEASLIFAVHLSTAGWRKMERCQMSKVPAFPLQLYNPRKHWKTSTDTTAKWHHTTMVCTQTM